MKKSFFAFAFLSAAALAAQAAVVDSVTASQKWPWSKDIGVKYVLSSVSAPVDLHVSAVRDGNPVDVPAAAIKGNCYGIRQEGAGELTIDPVLAFGSEQVALTDLRIKISVTDTKGDPDEALYRIYDLNDGSCENVTRRDLLAGKWGAIETSYAAIDPNFRTDLEDVLIWTDVTNNPAYKTDKLVMRKVHAKDVVWPCGDPDDALTYQVGKIARRWVKLDYDYYIGVFEVTRAQYKKLTGSLPTSSGLGDNNEYAAYPACNMQHWEVNGHPGSDYDSYNTIRCNEKLWFPKNTYVRDVGKKTLCASLWDKTKVEFNMPTGAEWEYACRGGQWGVLYSGEEQTMANAKKIAWNTYNSGAVAHAVGLLKPNAFGLYDMLGNIMEHASYTGNLYDGAKSGAGESATDPALDPLGNPNPTYPGCSWYVVGGGYYNDSTYGAWQDMRPSMRCGWYPYYQTSVYVGTRLVCPVTAEWGADWPKTILEETAPVEAESVGTLYLGDERAATAGAGKANAKVLAYDECTTGGLLANIGKGILEKVDPQTVELFIGLNNVLTKPYADETPLDTVIGVREIATKLRAAYPSAMIWINPLAYDADTEAENVRRYAINKACVEINEGNSGRMFMRQPDWMYVYPGTNPWPTGGNSALTPYISKYWLANADDPRLKKKLAEKRAHTAGSYDCVMVGDSVTHFWENANGKPYFDANIAPTWDVFNLGFGGDSTYHTIWNLLYSGLFDGYTTPLFTVLIGNNNISESSTDADLEKVAQGCKRILDILKAKHPESKIVLFPLLPRGNAPGALRTLSGKYNDLIRKFADGTTVVWAGELWDAFLATADQDGNIPNNVFVDGVHPGTEGYRIWGEILKTYLPKKN